MHAIGRWVLAAAALVGWSVAMMAEICRMAIITSLGLISGAVVMNSMVMDLPTEKDGRLWPFGSALGHTRLCFW